MQLNVPVIDSKTLGAEREDSFQIDGSDPMIFQILRKSMYSDHIGAVCREVASNCRDAHREAGKPDLPIEIELSAKNANVWVVQGMRSITFRDFGVGISPGRMFNVFLRYLKSTKRDENTSTGGFGLGAKTPFAYSDTFTVVTTCETEWENGDTQYEYGRYTFVYHAMIDSTYKGKMVLFDFYLEEDPEKVGTEIIIPVKDQDVRTFQTKCFQYLGFWEVPPTYKGFDVSPPNIRRVYEFGKEWWFAEASTEYSAITVLLDGIPYKIDPRSISNLIPSWVKRISNSYSTEFLCLEFKTGDLMPAPSRENLEDWEQNWIKIAARYTMSILQMQTLVPSFISGAKSYIEACALMNEFIKDRNSSEKLSLIVLLNKYLDVELKNYSYKGVPLKSKDNPRQFFSIVEVRKKSHNYDFYKTQKVATITLDNLLPLYFFDTRKDIRRIESAWEKVGDHFLLAIPKFPDSAYYPSLPITEYENLGRHYKWQGEEGLNRLNQEKWIEEVFAIADDYPNIKGMFSEVPLTVRKVAGSASTYYQEKPEVQVHAQYCKGTDPFRKDTFLWVRDTQTFDVSSGVDCVLYDIVDSTSDSTFHSNSQIRRRRNLLALIAPKSRYCLITAKSKRYAESDPTWVTWDEFLELFVKGQDVPQIISEIYYNFFFQDIVGHSSLEHLISYKCLQAIPDAIPNTLFEFADEVKKRKSGKYIDTSSIDRQILENLYGDALNTPELLALTLIKGEAEKFNKKYPHLKDLLNSGYKEVKELRKSLLIYLNMADYSRDYLCF